MARSFGWLALLGVVCISTGCKMCNGNQDYAGPAFQDGYQTGDFYSRRGSVLGRGDPAAPTREAGMADPQPTAAPLPETPITPPNP